MAKRKEIGEPFPLPLFCPECFAPITGDNARLYPTSALDSGVGCNACWVNPLCPGECNGIHGGPVPRGARRTLRRDSIPGTWTCPTDEITYRYLGPNSEAGWADQGNWWADLYGGGSFLNPERTEWYESEVEWHAAACHWCDYCEAYYPPSDEHDCYHSLPDYDDDDYYEDEYRSDRPVRPINANWASSATHYDPITENVGTVDRIGGVPIPHFESLVAA